MITLSDGVATITLNHVLWPNRSRDKVAGSDRITMGGRVVSQRLAVSGGKEIILEARRDGRFQRGWFTWGQVMVLMAWRDAATRLTLTYGADVRSVTIPLTGIDIEPTKEQSIIPAADAICAGTLTLLEV